MHRHKTRYVPHVEMDERPGGLRLLCTRCRVEEILLLTPTANAEAARRFRLTHPSACGPIAPPQ